jgi:histidyl-tRNA synthetase
VFPEADKLGRQFRHASARGVPFVVVSGDDERARGEVAVKNMTTGEQVALPRGEAGRWIRSALAGPVGRS